MQLIEFTGQYHSVVLYTKNIHAFREIYGMVQFNCSIPFYQNLAGAEMYTAIQINNIHDGPGIAGYTYTNRHTASDRVRKQGNTIIRLVNL